MNDATQGPITLHNVRLAFADGLWRAEAMEAGKTPKFSISIIVPKDHPQIPLIKARMAAVRHAKWGANPPGNIKYCLRDGSEKSHLAGFGPDVMFFTTSSKTRPGVFDRDGRTPLTEADGKPYSGAWVNVMCDFWAQDPEQNPEWGKKINSEFSGVQFARDDEAFSGGLPPAQAGAFNPLEGAESNDAAAAGFGQVGATSAAPDPLAAGAPADDPLAF